MASLNLSPTNQDKFRLHSEKPLNFAQYLCKCCKIRRSVGQFHHGRDICDRCIKRGAKAA